MGKHANGHRIHRNSATAYDGADLGDRERMVLDTIAASPLPLSDRQIMERLGFTDMNSVRPAITHLHDRERLVEAGDIEDHLTGRRVRTSRIATPIQQRLLA